MAYSDRTYVGTGSGLGPEGVTVYYVKLSHCNLCGNLNGSLYFGIASVPVPVPHKFCLIRP